MANPARVVVLPRETATLAIEEIDLPDPGPTQVIVRQFASGICHSQLHQMHRPRNSPVILVITSYSIHYTKLYDAVCSSSVKW